MIPLDLAQIRYFLSVADNLSFTRASEELYVSQPTISKQIALLERELGVKLFIRDNHSVRLTYIGQMLYPDFREALSLIDTAVQKAASTTADVRGQIRIGIGSMMDINYIMPGFLRAFSQVYPEIRLKITSHPFSVLQQKLEGGELDVIFTYSLEPPKKGDQTRMVVSRSHTFLYYSQVLMLQESGPLSLQDFVDKPLLRLREHSSDSATSNYYSDVAACSGLQFQHVVEVPDMETMILYLESGLGVCIMGRSYRINTSANIRAIDLSMTDHLASVGTDAIWRKSNHNPSLQLLLDEIRQYTSSDDLI